MSKINETRRHIDKMLKDTKATLYTMAEEALASGALSEEMKAKDNWLLAKGIIDTWCRKRPYQPLDFRTITEFNNLSHFI